MHMFPVAVYHKNTNWTRGKRELKKIGAYSWEILLKLLLASKMFRAFQLFPLGKITSSVLNSRTILISKIHYYTAAALGIIKRHIFKPTVSNSLNISLRVGRCSQSLAECQCLGKNANKALKFLIQRSFLKAPPPAISSNGTMPKAEIIQQIRNLVILLNLDQC